MYRYRVYIYMCVCMTMETHPGNEEGPSWSIRVHQVGLLYQTLMVADRTSRRKVQTFLVGGLNPSEKY